jgi:hypothetical protein
MIIKSIHRIVHTLPSLKSICILAFILVGFVASAQEEPPRPMVVTTYQNLSFGAIILGNSGGTVTVDPEGSRSYTGDVILANMGHSYYPAIFEVDALPGSLITIDLGGPVVLSYGGYSMTMLLNSTLPHSPFINTKSNNTEVRIGGKLTVGSSLSNPAGDYLGYFTVTFIQQ